MTQGSSSLQPMADPYDAYLKSWEVDDPAEALDAAIACLEAVISDPTESKRYVRRYQSALDMIREQPLILVPVIHSNEQLIVADEVPAERDYSCEDHGDTRGDEKCCRKAVWVDWDSDLSFLEDTQRSLLSAQERMVTLQASRARSEAQLDGIKRWIRGLVEMKYGDLSAGEIQAEARRILEHLESESTGS